MKKKILIIVANYYENIANSLLNSAKNKIKNKVKKTPFPSIISIFDPSI